jgi:cation transport ATPase
MRVDLPQIFDSLSGACEAFLRDQPGIQEVRLNPGCRSVVLHYNPDVLEADDLVTLVKELPLDQLNTYQPRNPPPQAEDAASMAWLPLALSSAAVALTVFAEAAIAPWLVAGAAVPIFTRAFEAMSQRGKLNLDVLDAAATAVLAVQGQIQTAALMVWLVSLGDVIRELTMQRSRRAIEELFDRRTQFAWVVRGGEKMKVHVEDILDGDQVVVYTGDLITVDGTVVSGRATVDQKVLTGESMPVEKNVGDQVYAATVVRDGKAVSDGDEGGA